MKRELPIWRSMLFVPAHVEKYVDAARSRGADAYILDLEDSVPMALKAQARAALALGARKVAVDGAAVLVRINGDPLLARDDIRAAVSPDIKALMVPKVENRGQIEEIARQLDEAERTCGVASGHTQLIAQIEHINALPNLDSIAGSSTRLMGMILGSEDFSVSAGMTPTSEALYGPNQQVLFACRRAGILPYGFPGSISLFRDLGQFRQIIGRARDMGFVGAYAIHPDQVAVMNELFAPSDEEVEWAIGLLAAADEAERLGRGAFEYRGRMADPPVVARASEVLRKHASVRKVQTGPNPGRVS